MLENSSDTQTDKTLSVNSEDCTNTERTNDGISSADEPRNDDNKEEVGDLGKAQKKIRSGFMWLGIASIISQVLDAISLLIVMMFVGKADLGLATLAVSFSKCLEAFNGLGVGKALVQDGQLTSNETDSLFWLTVIVGIVMSLIMIPIAWAGSIFYNDEALFVLVLFCLIKVFTGGIAEVPKKLIERRLQYSKSTLIIVVSTFSSSIAKILLAILGAGAWALVGAHVLYGLAYVVMAFILSHYWPRIHFKLEECRRFVQFGIRYCCSNLIETLNKNIHYFIVGKFFGESILGVYRVGYELAMTPALALLNVVNESSYAVFAKVKEKKEELSSLFAWNQGNIAIFSLVPIVFILFCSKDIFSLINNGEWMDATSFISLALVVAFAKALVQTFPELYRACGKPGYALKTDAFECTLICLFFISALAICYFFGVANDRALNVLFTAWILLFIPLLAFHLKLAKTLILTGLRSTVKSISKALAFGVVSVGLSLPCWFVQDNLPWQPWGHMAIEVVILLICIGIYAKWIRQKRI